MTDPPTDIAEKVTNDSTAQQPAKPDDSPPLGNFEEHKQADAADKPLPKDAEELSGAVLNEKLLEVLKEIAELKGFITGDQKLNSDGLGIVERFFSSGLFFIVLGSLLLVFAYSRIGIVHSSFTFVLVVLGVAVLLFGTGTQGLGKLDSKTATANYNIALAGGAGVLALFIGFGMVHYSGDMQKIFSVEKKQILAELKPKPNGVASDFNNYWAKFVLGGEALASVQREGTYMVYVPYFENQTGKTLEVSYTFVAKNPTNANLALTVDGILKIPLTSENIAAEDGGYSFPIAKNLEGSVVDMVSTTNSKVLLTNVKGDNPLDVKIGITEPSNIPPDQLDAQ